MWMCGVLSGGRYRSGGIETTQGRSRTCDKKCDDHDGSDRWKEWFRFPLYESFKYVKVVSLWLEVTILSRRVCKLKKRKVSFFFFPPSIAPRALSHSLYLRLRALSSPYPLPPSFSLPLLQWSALEIAGVSIFCPPIPLCRPSKWCRIFLNTFPKCWFYHNIRQHNHYSYTDGMQEYPAWLEQSLALDLARTLTVSNLPSGDRKFM